MREASWRVRGWFPQLKFHTHDDEELFRKGKSVRGGHVQTESTGSVSLTML